MMSLDEQLAYLRAAAEGMERHAYVALRRGSPEFHRRAADAEAATVNIEAPMATTTEEYLNETGLNDCYSIPPRTASRWRASGDGPPFIRLGKRRIIYRRTDVEAWLANRTFNSLAEEAAGRTKHRVVTAIGETVVSDPLDAVSDKVPATRRG
jgi:hypothetical protein